MLWHVDETYIQVAGKWRYLWRIVDQRGQFVDFWLTTKRDSKAAKAFLVLPLKSEHDMANLLLLLINATVPLLVLFKALILT